MKTHDHEAGEELLGVIDLKNGKMVQVIIYSHILTIRDNTFIFNLFNIWPPSSLTSWPHLQSFQLPQPPNFFLRVWTTQVQLLTGNSLSWLAAAVDVLFPPPFDIPIKGKQEWEQTWSMLSPALLLLVLCTLENYLSRLTGNSLSLHLYILTPS